MNDEPREKCTICDKPFTDEAWEDRHTTPDGPCHDLCCVECEPEPAA